MATFCTSNIIIWSKTLRFCGAGFGGNEARGLWSKRMRAFALSTLCLVCASVASGFLSITQSPMQSTLLPGSHGSICSSICSSSTAQTGGGRRGLGWGCCKTAAMHPPQLRCNVSPMPATQTQNPSSRRSAAVVRCCTAGGEGVNVGEEEEEAEPYLVLNDGVHDSLREWARLRGVEWQGWDLANFPELNIRGAVALKDIREDDLLVSVPISSGITLSPDTECPFPASFARSEAWEGCKKWEYKMALSLLWDRCNADSPRRAFINALPPSVSSLRLYKDGQLDELQDPVLKSRVLKWAEESAAEWNRVSQYVADGISLSKADWDWALDMVRSRTFYAQTSKEGKGKGIYGMYPMADMLNHEFGSTDVAITEGKGGEMCFQISSGRDVKEGHQVMISYGALDNGQLMEGYGFYDETNEMDAVWLSEGELKDAAKSLLGEDEVVAATSLCHELGVGPGEGVEGGNYAVYKSGEGEELMVCLRRLCIDEVDVRGEEGRTLAKERFDAKDPISLESECRAWRVLAAACEARLASLPTTAEQDEDVMEELDEQLAAGLASEEEEQENERMFTCVGFRLVRKALLVDCIMRSRFFAKDSEERGGLVGFNVISVESK